MNEVSIIIYENEPKNPQSIQIEYLDADKDDELFKMLLEIFQDGMKKYHSYDGVVALETVKDEEMLIMRKYFWSFGFDIFYKVFDLKDNLLKNFDKNTKIGKSLLKDYYITLKTQYYKFEISFDYYCENYAR